MDLTQIYMWNIITLCLLNCPGSSLDTIPQLFSMCLEDSWIDPTCGKSALKRAVHNVDNYA